MSVLMELVSASCSTLLLKRPPLCSSSSMALFAPSLKFKSLSLKPSGHRLFFESSRAFVPKGLRVDFRSGNSLNRPIVAFAASHEDSHSKIEVEKESEDRKLRGEESEEVWKQALESFKEQALKLQSVSQEAYEIYSKKGMVVLQETSEKLKIQAEKAKSDLGGIAKEFGGDSIELLTVATENSPEPVKEVVETLASSTDNLNDVSKVRDFQLGIPYGLLLSTSGFLSFMLSGSLSSLRFGFILGGILLALSVSSLKSYKRAEPYSLALKGQAAIATIIFLRDISIIMTRKTSFLTPLATLIRFLVPGLFCYHISFTTIVVRLLRLSIVADGKDGSLVKVKLFSYKLTIDGVLQCVNFDGENSRLKFERKSYRICHQILSGALHGSFIMQPLMKLLSNERRIAM